MRVLTVDASAWRTKKDLIDGILAVLDPPDWHGRNLDALFDSMYAGDINGVDPPYKLRVLGVSGLPAELVLVLGSLRDDLLVEHEGLLGETGEARRVLISLEP